MDQQDADMMRRWQDGDAGAFEDLVRRWERRIARFLCRLGSRPDQVADLCQEVFLRLYLKGPYYREAGTFSTWLYRIALNVARDNGRRLRRTPQTLQDHETSAPAAAGPGSWEQQELIEAVQKALAGMPDSLRTVLVLRHYEGLNFEQMARLLGKPASTLKSRLRRRTGAIARHADTTGLEPQETMG